MVESTSKYTSMCGDYKIIKTIGVGGSAPVKLVEKDSKQFAMKIFVYDPKGWDDLVKTIKSEFEIVSKLNRTSIVEYIEFNENAIWTKSTGEKVKCCFLVMQYLRAAELL